jgi:hypothetical protein
MNWHEFDLDHAEEVLGDIRQDLKIYGPFQASLCGIDRAKDLEAAIDMYHRFADLDLDDILAN